MEMIATAGIVEEDLVKGAAVFKSFAYFFGFLSAGSFRQYNVDSIAPVRSNNVLTGR